MSMKFSTLFFAITLAGQTIFASTHLSNIMDQQVYDPSGNPFIVDQDLVIPKDKQVTFKAGCVFLFNSFTGLTVYGDLLVEGTPESPVVFTSTNDNNYSVKTQQLPNAFDWNGIYVHETAGNVKFRNFRLMFSVYGIKSDKEDVVIQNAQFKQNGQFHCIIKDRILYIQDNISYSYNSIQKENKKADPAPEKIKSDSTIPATVSTKTDVSGNSTPQQEKTKKGKKIAAYTFLGIGIGTGVACAASSYKASNYKKQVNTLNMQIDAGLPQEDLATSIQNRDAKISSFKTARLIAIGTGIASGASLITAIILFSTMGSSSQAQNLSFSVDPEGKKVSLLFSMGF